MKKLILGLVICLMMAGVANAGIYTYLPSPVDLYDLDHYKYYKWGVSWTHTNEYIVGATLKFRNMYDWIHEDGDSLYVHLLDNPPVGVTTYTDNQGGGDNFAGTPWVGTWTDLFGDPSHKQTVIYDLGALGLLPTFRTYAADGVIGFGIDPDCHYFNDKVELKIFTETVPEPATMTLLGLGLLGAGLFSRRKK